MSNEQFTPEQLKAQRKAELEFNLRKAKEEENFFYRASRGLSANTLKFPNPKTYEEQQSYMKKSLEARSKWQRIQSELSKLDEETS